MIAVIYRIKLEEPLLATSLEGEPNSAISFDYIPGSLLRGAVAGRLTLGGSTADLATGERALLFNGAVRYLNAYPGLAGESNRRLPTPLSWKVKKEDAGQDDATVWDYALLSAEERQETGQTKDLSGYTLLEDEAATRYRPERQIAVHTLRDRNAGRSTRVLGSVYRYDALAPGEHFLGAVLAETLDQAKRIQRILEEGTYRLGGAQGGGYGKVTILDVRVDENWAEISGGPRAIPAGEEFRVTLLSDAILRDKWGVATLDLTGALPFRVEPAPSFRRPTYVGGFNRKWGLPLPQEQALKAGTVFVLKAAEAISQEELKRLVEQGIGERRAEGFGRLAINWGQDKEFTSPAVRRARAQPQAPASLGDDAARMARRMETRLLRRNLDRALVQAVQDSKVKGDISNSQLSRLRIVARSALAETKEAGSDSAALQRLATLFDESNSQSLRPTALKKYNKVRVEGQRLPDWITGLARDPTRVWQILGAPSPKKLWARDPAADDWNQHLAVEYAVRLMDGVLEKKMKENR